jgi:hypothetical protein
MFHDQPGVEENGGRARKEKEEGSRLLYAGKSQRKCDWMKDGVLEAGTAR